MFQFLAIKQAGCRRALPRRLHVGRIARVALAMAALAAQLLLAQSARAAKDDRPNIVLIMADDMGFSDAGCYGGEIRTPNVDRLAEGGLRFRQFYNCAVCGTTRASLLTGLYHHQLGIHRWTGTINDRGVLFTELLNRAGYRTMMVGKWDGSVPAKERGIDRFFGFNTLGPISYFRAVSSSPFYLDRERYKLPDDFFITDALTDYAVQFIEEAAKGDQPFFLYSANIAPHWPLHAREEDIARYRELYAREGWDKLRAARHRRQLEMGLVDARWKLPSRDARVPAWAEAKHQNWQAERMAVYAAQIDRLDQNIGRMLAALEKAGVMENTLVLFLSDNGPSDRAGYSTARLNNYRGTGKPWRDDGTLMKAGNHPAITPGREGTFTSYGPPWANVSATPFRQYKSTSYEGGIATPLVAHWPRVIRQRGELTDQVGHVMDIAVTCLDLADVEYPAELTGRKLLPLEGRSLRPIFEGKEREAHEALFWEYAGSRAVRQGPWKLVALKGRPWELYNVETDRTEMHNLAQRQPQRAEQMAASWDAWAKRVGTSDKN